MSAQSCTIFSLNPLYHEEDLIDAPDLLGLWQDKDEEGEYISFEKYEDKKYIFRYMETQDDTNKSIIDSVSFEVGLLKLGDHYYIDAYPYYDEDFEEGDYLIRGFIPTHSFLKIEWNKQSMALYEFSYDQLKELFEQNRIRIQHQMFEDYIVITASTDDLQKFIRKYADDANVFNEPDRFVKIR
jgi:hypothetical protein